MSQTNVYASSDEQELMFDSLGNLETDECRSSTSPTCGTSTPSIPDSLDLSGLDSDTEPRSVSVNLFERVGEDDSLSDETEDEERRRRLEEDDSTSSDSESEGTQIWVPTGTKRPPITLPKPPSSHQLKTSNSSIPRDTVVTQNHVAGRPDTELLPTSSLIATTERSSSHYSSQESLQMTESKPLRPNNNGPVHLSPSRNQLPASEMVAMNENKSASLFSILSGLYAVFLVILGIVFPIAELFSRPVEYNFFEGFYLYIYGISIVFLLYVYIYLLSSKTCGKSKQRGFLQRRSIDREEKVFLDKSGRHTGSFYLRLGAVVFGVGSMIHDGLFLGEYFDNICVNVLLAVRPMMHLGFTFIQMYFIFFNSMMCIYKYRIFARFGLMHMFATNLCVWFRNVVKETHRHYSGEMFNSQNLSAVISNEPSDNSSVCNGGKIMHQVVNSASPYLYPCTVCYSLIAAGILFIIWRNIGKSTDNQSSASINRYKNNNKPVLKGDCQGTNRGLFAGIFILVAAIVTMIVFFVLVGQPSYVHIAIILAHSTEIVIYSFSSIAGIFAIIKMMKLFFNKEQDIQLEQVLLLVSVIGVYIHAIFSIVSGVYSLSDISGILIIASGILIIIESSIQTMLLVFGLHLWLHQSQQQYGKPGRQFVTFLLVCNIAMWGIDVFGGLRSYANPVQLNFYGNLIWSLILQTSLPLCIFYHFHSTVCLTMIWQNAYKCKQSNSNNDV